MSSGWGGVGWGGVGCDNNTVEVLTKGKMRFLRWLPY